MNLEIANRLVELRKKFGYSQEALAEKLGISRQAISKWERAEASPDTDNLMALASLYGMTLDQLINTDSAIPENEEEAPKIVKISNKIKDKGREILNSALYPETAKKMFRFPFPVFVAVFYVAICLILKEKSAFPYPWHPWWLVFMTVPIYYMIAAACRTTSKKAFMFVMPVPVVVVTVYLMIGFLGGVWGASALLFVIIPLYYWFITFYVKGKKKSKKQ